MTDPGKLKLLYDSVSKTYDTGTFEEFQAYLSDDDKRQQFFDVIIKPNYEVTDISEFESLYGLKKKDESELTPQEAAMESATKEEPPVTLSDSSRNEFDYESFIDKSEEEAITDLQEQLVGKGYSVEETGIANALLVTDNVTGQATTIDLKPIGFLPSGQRKVKEDEIAKVKSLIETPADPKKAIISNNQFSFYNQNRSEYVKQLQQDYKEFDFNYLEDGTVQISKDGLSQTFDIQTPGSKGRQQFADMNKFLYDNMSETDLDTRASQLYAQIEQDVKNANADIDISDESAESKFYSSEYFKGLFKMLEESGTVIPEEARQELESGQKIVGYTPRENLAMYGPMDKSDIQDGIVKYFSNDPEALEKIQKYNDTGVGRSKAGLIERAKKLAIERYYEDRPDRERAKQIVLQKYTELNNREQEVLTNLEIQNQDLDKMQAGIVADFKDLQQKYPGIGMEWNDESNSLVLYGKDIPQEAKDLHKRLSDNVEAYKAVSKSAAASLDKDASSKETVDQFMDAAKRNYSVYDASMADLKNALLQMAGGAAIVGELMTGGPDVNISLVRGDMAESRENLDNFYRTKRTYSEAAKEGRFGAFATRTIAEQAPNIALAIGSAGMGSAVGLSEAAISTLVASQFGITSAGNKYDELTTRQEFASIARKGLEELESIKDNLSQEEYLSQKYELERAIKDGEISAMDKTLSVIGTGLVEGAITRYFGSIPNSIKILKDLRGPSRFMDDILMSRGKASLNALKDFGKRTVGEVFEETSIDALTQLNDYAFLGDQVDISTLDDVALTSIITSGAMNTPSIGYSTIMTQVNVNRYKNKIKGITGKINTLKDMLNDPDMSDIQRSSIHNQINTLVSQISNETSKMEGDALLLGPEAIQELSTLSGVRDNMLKKAGVQPDDSYDIANAKVKNHLKGLDQDAAKKFIDNMKFIDGRRNEIIESINYDNAVERVFGDKGAEIANTLDPTLSPQDRYNEVYKQIRQEINDNAKAEYDAIQEQETRDIPDAQPAEGVQEVEAEVRKPVVEEEEKIKDSQIPANAEIYTYENDNGDIIKVRVVTNLDGSRQIREVDENNKPVGAANNISKNNTLGTEEYVTKAYGDVVSKEDIDLDQVINPKMVDKMSTRQKKAVGIEEAAPVVEEEVTPELYTLPETKKEWVNDFNIIDNRDGKAGLEINEDDGKTGRWYVENNKTGYIGATATKAEAQKVINDPNLMDYGEGEPIIVEPKTQEDAKTTIKVKPGNRLFNEPLKEVDEVANGYYQRVFDSPRPKFEGTTELDKERAKRISDAFEAMEYNPNDPEVKAAYEALSKETLDQYQAFLDAGYTVEIDNVDAYGNSQEMIDDLRQNKRIKIFSTEAGFGKDPITDKQRQENPLLRDSGFKDVNGQTMLINDVFRAIHDFFGHAELGNGFGPKGEENAWNVHARMFSPLARRAMTTETRGQNSYVNFSGVNEKVEALRDQARALRDQGKETEAQKIVDEIYALTEFANQKIGLLPEEFSKTDEELAFPAESKKRPPSAKKILGIKREKKVVDVYAALKDQIRLEARAAREAQRDLNVRRKELSNTIKGLKRKGQITTSQSLVMVNAISSVNLNNVASVDKLIKYMDKVFENAEYADKIARSNKKRETAKNNIRSKIGSAKATFNNLNKVFSINARLIPDSVLETYIELVDQFGVRGAVLKLEEVSAINEKAVEVINAIDAEISEIPKLQQVFDTYPNKRMKDGKVDFTSTIEDMVKDGTIQREDADLMNKYKKDILPTEEKAEAEAVEYTFEVKDNNVVDALDKESAQRFLDLVENHPEALEQLSENEKKNLQGVIDNIEAGFFPSYGNNLSNEIESIVAKDIVLPRVKKGSRYIFDRLISNMKVLGAQAYRSMFKTKDKPKTSTEYSIRANPLSDIDNVLGNMNRTDIYDNVFGKAARSLATLDAEIDIVQEKLMKAEALLNKQYKTGNKIVKSKFRIMAYMLEREFQSNRDSDKVFSAVDALEATIQAYGKNKTKSIYSKKDISILKEILQEFKDGNIDDIYNSFSNRDKQAIKLIDEVNTSLSDKALHTASVVRGSRPTMLDNYVHHSVASVDANSLETVTSKYNQFKTFSTKAGTLVERTPGVKALNFDVLNATMKGARETLTDYHMTNTAKTIFKTLNKLKSDIVDDENSTEKEIELANALIDSFDTAMRIVFEKSYSPVELGFLNSLKGLGYKALLASVPRATAELGSNVGYVMTTSPAAFISGYKNYREYVMSQRGRDVMLNLNSEVTGKNYSKKVTGKTADIGLFVDAEGISRSSAVNDVQDKANYILSFPKKLINILAEKPAEFLISAPDKAISRPLWFGSLSSKFKELTGNDIDMDAIENNDAAYLRENKDALDKATRFADKEVTRAATSINVFNGVLKNKINPNDSGTQKAFKEINGFMTNFIVYEYTTARAGITALIHGGEISRAEGVRLLAGTTLRMSMYMVLYQMLSHAFDAAAAAVTGVDFGDDQPEDLDDLFARQLVGSIVSTMIGKNMGNIAKIGPMMGLEYINETYLQGLRDGKDFDPYKHSMSYSMLSREAIENILEGKKGPFDAIIPAVSGPYSPMAKTMQRGITVLSRATTAKKEETRERAKNELKNRIVLEMLGNLGLIPLYKDVRRIVLKDMFKKEEKRPTRRISF